MMIIAKNKTYLVIFTIISILECFGSLFFCFVFSYKQKKRLVCWERIYIFLKFKTLEGASRND